MNPRGVGKGMTEPVMYRQVNDTREQPWSLPGAGAAARQEMIEIGGGKLIASANDASSDVSGLVRPPRSRSREASATL